VGGFGGFGVGFGGVGLFVWFGLGVVGGVVGFLGGSTGLQPLQRATRGRRNKMCSPRRGAGEPKQGHTVTTKTAEADANWLKVSKDRIGETEAPITKAGQKQKSEEGKLEKREPRTGTKRRIERKHVTNAGCCVYHPDNTGMPPKQEIPFAKGGEEKERGEIQDSIPLGGG